MKFLSTVMFAALCAFFSNSLMAGEEKVSKSERGTKFREEITDCKLDMLHRIRALERYVHTCQVDAKEWLVQRINQFPETIDAYAIVNYEPNPGLMLWTAEDWGGAIPLPSEGDTLRYKMPPPTEKNRITKQTCIELEMIRAAADFPSSLVFEAFLSVVLNDRLPIELRIEAAKQLRKLETFLRGPPPGQAVVWQIPERFLPQGKLASVRKRLRMVTPVGETTPSLGLRGYKGASLSEIVKDISSLIPAEKGVPDGSLGKPAAKPGERPAIP